MLSPAQEIVCLRFRKALPIAVERVGRLPCVLVCEKDHALDRSEIRLYELGRTGFWMLYAFEPRQIDTDGALFSRGIVMRISEDWMRRLVERLLAVRIVEIVRR
jgi:hypothetical protein